MSSRQTKQIIGAVVVLISVLTLIFSDNSSSLSSPFKSSSVSPTPTSVVVKDVKGSSVSEVSNIDKSSDQIPEDVGVENFTASEGQEAYKVIKVVDGDTIDVDINGEISRLRLIGIDTPETVDPRKPVQCFGREASNKAKELLQGQFIFLESDETQGERDKYKRLLRYVFLPDGRNFNLLMISSGYAHEYTYDEPYKYQADFKQAEIDARS
ncbi:MAG: thermonuclease family protein, partial [Patescibacteria group bacterium]